MTDKQINTCEFQSNCIEYKDISYLKNMPICAIHELSIACHDKVNKCKYYKLYKQLKHKEQECERLINKNNRLEEKLNTTRLLLEGKNNQYAAKTQECERLKYNNGYEVGALEKTIDNLTAKNEKLKKQTEIFTRQLEKANKEVIKEKEKNATQRQKNEKLKAENEELKRRVTEIFACLINANRSGIITDTIWVGTITTLWDYIAQTLKIEGDQIQIEEQVLQKISECEGDNE